MKPDLKSKLIGGVIFREGEVIAISGVGFYLVKITKRGLDLRLHNPRKEAEQ